MPELKGKNFSMKDYLKNEDKNYHTENAVELVNLYGTAKEKKEIKAIHDRHMTPKGMFNRTGISVGDYADRKQLHNKYYQRFSDEQSKKAKPELSKGSYIKENRPNLNGRTTGTLSADKKKQKGSLSVDKRMWL